MDLETERRPSEVVGDTPRPSAAASGDIMDQLPRAKIDALMVRPSIRHVVGGRRRVGNAMSRGRCVPGLGKALKRFRLRAKQ
jgi:hypothetical protein